MPAREFCKVRNVPGGEAPGRLARQDEGQGATQGHLATDIIAGFADPAYQRHHETQRQLEGALTHLAQALAVWPEGTPSETGVASVDVRLKAAVKALRQARIATANALVRSVKGSEKHVARSRAAL